MLEVDLVDVGVVEDRETRLDLRHGVFHRAVEEVEDRRSVVAGQSVGIAEEERIALGVGELQVEVAGEVEAELQAHVFEEVEGRGHETVALEMPVVLTLELAELADLRVPAAALGHDGRLGLAAVAQPRLVDVDVAVFRRRVAVEAVDEVDLDPGRQVLSPLGQTLDGHHRHFHVGARFDRLHERHLVAGRQREVGQTEERAGESTAVAVAVVGPDLQAQAVAGMLLLLLEEHHLLLDLAGKRQSRERRQGDDQRESTARDAHGLRPPVTTSPPGRRPCGAATPPESGAPGR